jgi:CRP-like cAMP-binding protein
MPLTVVPRRDRKLYRIVKAGEEIRLKRGESLFRSGDPARDLYLVRSGHLGLTVSLPRGGGRNRVAVERTVAVRGPWEILGEEALVRGVTRRYGAAAGEISTVTVLDGDGALAALKTAPKTLANFLQAQEDILYRARVRRPGFYASSAEERMADVLMDLSQRLGVEHGRGLRIPHWFTHQELADLAGAHRSTVTTILNDWIYDGILKTDGKTIVVMRPAALRKKGAILPQE